MALAASHAYTGLAFSYSDILQEIESMRQLTKDFMHRDSGIKIQEFHRELRNFSSDRRPQDYSWCILEEDPIRTIESDGKFERGGRKGITVYGTISTLWEISHDPKNTKRFILSGNASVKMCVFEVAVDGGEDKEIARWRFEIGSYDSPGCHFHTQILGGENDEMFPHSLPVPRLPSLLITPMDALDFLLGELFQDDWYRKSSEISNSNLTTWAARQRRRLSNLLKWKLSMVEKESGSPWMVLKHEKPGNINMLCE